MVRFPFINRPTLIMTQRYCAQVAMQFRKTLDDITHEFEDLDVPSALESLNAAVQLTRQVEIQCRVDLMTIRGSIDNLYEVLESAMFAKVTDQQLVAILSRAKVRLNAVERDIFEQFSQGQITIG